MTLVSARITVSNDLILLFLLAVRRAFLQIFVKAPAREWQIEGALRVKKSTIILSLLFAVCKEKIFADHAKTQITESACSRQEARLAGDPDFCIFLTRGGEAAIRRLPLLTPWWAA